MQVTELGLETKGQRLKGPSVAVNSPKCVNRRETAQSNSYNLCPFPHDGCFYHLQLQSFGGSLLCAASLRGLSTSSEVLAIRKLPSPAPSPGEHDQDFKIQFIQ